MPAVALDLRSNSKCAIAADPSPGMGLFEDGGKLWLGPWQWHLDLGLGGFWGAPLLIDPLSGTYQDLGSNPQATMRVAARNGLADRLGLDRALLPDTNLADLLAHYVLGTLADPTGINRVKPLRMGRKGLSLHLGSFGLVLHEPFSRNHPNFDAALAVRWADYRRNKAAGVPLEALQRWTGHDALALFRRRPTAADLDLLLPPEFRGDGSRDPRTTILDDFNRADQAGLGTSSEGWSWVSQTGTIDVVSNQAKWSATNHAAYRADSNLSTDDHKSEVDTVGTISGTKYFSPTVRASAAAVTYYAYLARDNSTNSKLHKRVNGTFTNSALGVQHGATGRVGVSADGSTIEGYFDSDTAEVAWTDTAITGNLQAGVTAREANDIGDNFEAADLAAPSAGFAHSQAVILG